MPGISIRFQHWVMGTILVLVLVFTGAFSCLVLGALRADHERIAQARLDAITTSTEAAQLDELTAAVDRSQQHVALLAAALLLVLLPAAWFGTRRVAGQLAALERNSVRLEALDAAVSPERVRSPLREIDRLGRSLEATHAHVLQHARELMHAREALAQLVQACLELGRTPDRQELLSHLVTVAREMTGARWSYARMRDAGDVLRVAARSGEFRDPVRDIPLRDDSTGEFQIQFASTVCALEGRVLFVDDVDAGTDARPHVLNLRGRNLSARFRARSLVAVPILGEAAQALGVLVLVDDAEDEGRGARPFDRRRIALVEALAAQAAVVHDRQALVQEQRDLVDAIVRMLATAIDAKSAHTGAHCERVPELACMLAEEACRASHGPLAGFRFETEEQWREFRIGAWLHDLGKITTPDHVMDKATKLDLHHNRIHEVRMRFEVLLRDAWIDALQSIGSGADESSAWSGFHTRQRRLQDDFAFVARCNLGGERMAQADLDHLREIGKQTWWRHFDDTLGLSNAERVRRRGHPSVRGLPSREALLADKPHHRIMRGPKAGAAALAGLAMDVPELQEHHGELHNLGIRAGTLNEQERFHIKDHVIQTLRMLEAVPFPPRLRRVAEYAGTHHETLTGTGYPRRLDASRLSIPARIMAIADIFEALTAGDRPYKRAHMLSEAVRLLHGFKQRRHIDPELFDLFLSSGVYLRYGRRYLRPEQIDAVDIKQYLGEVVAAP